MSIPEKTIQEVKNIAYEWQKKIQVSRKGKEQDFHDMMMKMLKNPINKIFLIELLDQSFRSKNADRVADQLEHIFTKYKSTDFFSQFEQILIWLFRDVGIYVSSISIPLFIKYLRNDISSIVIKGEDPLLAKHMKARRDEGTRVNINVIGEIVLSEEEAGERVNKYIKLLQNPDVDYLSIKISNLFSQIIPHAHDNNIAKISAQLEKVYRSAMKNTYKDKDGKNKHKFVNLDMEEYRDIEITIDSFKNVLEQEEFKNFYAGIVIQTYLPDAMIYIRDLASWAKNRVANGGAPIKIRIVKGANQEMELTEASLRGWNNVTYSSKAQSDANFKIAMDFLLDPEVAPYVHTGVASHNLFDHALAMLLAKERGTREYCSAEMLEGMSEAAYEVLKDEGLNVILYAPTATKDTFTNAIAYLVRRFDENTADQNFLRHSFGLEVNTPAWETLIKSYDDAIALIPTLDQKPYRTQDRNKEISKKNIDPKDYHFENEPDTDFVLKANRKWAEGIRSKWQNIGEIGGFNAYPVVGGKIVQRDENIIDVIDKSQYHEKKLTGHYTQANEDDMRVAVATAKEDPDGWRKLHYLERQKILMDVAHELRLARADLIGVAAAEVGKVFTETDVEVSEAIDFANFYPYSVAKMSGLTGVQASGKGVGLVISPWNFPIAIPVGGIVASLAAGNTVILKPAEDSILCGYRLCQCFWDAGISKNTLQFLPAVGSEVGKHVIPSKDINFTIFTGGEKTAYNIIKSRPDISLSAETGGKDATIVTALADRDQAIKNVVVSAFHNSGQKCSATSLLILEKEVYEDEGFKKTLKEAVESLQTGSVWNFSNRIGTLANLPSEELKKSLTYLDDGEEWLVPPTYADKGNPYMLTPSVRWGTKKNDFCHMNELFGPVLSVMCADNLEHAIELVNSTGYGLTSGIETLDKREQDYWRDKILAGNLYINRGTTGAIVIRQPFGGMRKSAIGSGKKAGGFNYVSQFMNIDYKETNIYESCSTQFIDQMRSLLTRDTVFNDECELALRHISHFAHWHEVEFLKEHDYSHIRGESNITRYLPVESVLLRVEEKDELDEILTTIMAIKMVGAKIHISIPKRSKKAEFIWLESKQASFIGKEDSIKRDDEDELIEMMPKVQRVRFLHPDNVRQNIYERVASEAIYIANNPFVSHGRLELMHYFIEQSISNSYHRYGNLGIQGLTLEEV
ncbi:MAG: bifunctional proline dehydrogenase/L-glutamate gamma-semialdehyde dehydrogenase [Sulfurimonas sp.]|uniref:bifunctional proline dehydrogenase/L-glutamate gamma-semialdehyde dehydrogenase n=1 Tax=Sulfurimonas sp. TaxID=2022749 RepID=UPI002623F4A3|nr:bifunctional proline dehydrogenase/L-glutamate gamma-semialdehyde dehydrogenase [Sulfurimonas sp.]MCW8894465.1 bifunctional proline dehydrogenase/L-glutamate gamma-semialdehyde dehydrogenase [Sulfurimonas sp.]MCW8954081.1 bifunctional proline dehydrogenase/L-glutamate gamma-semialdehyde dehydrogenase [Sulfurimonas sp.]MCW9068163.1 bifunctional proline dehydrogenase/L-glutamate gamma-semialdehyde dehydrogenase [Sulfurimonas sp.]